MVMKLSHTLNNCYVFCLGIALSVQPVKKCSVTEVTLRNHAKSILVEKADAQEKTETLHSELLFK